MYEKVEKDISLRRVLLVTPVLHDSDEWRSLLARVEGLSTRMTTTEANVTAANLKMDALMATQAMQHQQNQEAIHNQAHEIEKLSEAINGTGPDHPGLNGNMVRLVTINSQNNAWLKALLAFLIPAILALGSWFAHLEFAGKVSQNAAPVSRGSNAPQNADNPPL